MPRWVRPIRGVTQCERELQAARGVSGRASVEHDSPSRLTRIPCANVVHVSEEAQTGILREPPEMFEAGVSLVATTSVATAFGFVGGVAEDALRVVAALVAPDCE